VAKSNRRDGARANGGGRSAPKRDGSSVEARDGRRNRIAATEPEKPSRNGLTTETVQLLSDAEEAEFQETVRRRLQLVGEDPDREGLARTPKRVARSLAWLTRGYRQDAWSAVGEGLFEEPHDNMVMVP
jgi:GTP cyclohydrolase I